MLKIKKIDTTGATMPGIGEMILEAVPTAQKINQLNWPDEWPVKPDTKFRVAHNGSEVLIRFDVKEECTMAHVPNDNGEVWTDSAVEFFISLGDLAYYNFEFSCIGRALAGYRELGQKTVHGSSEVMATIRRYSTLGEATFDERHIPQGWTLVVAIPLDAFFAHKLTTLDGVEATANVYKCGDKLSKAHYVSWRPIDTPKPSFHQPTFFDKIVFEKQIK